MLTRSIRATSCRYDRWQDVPIEFQGTDQSIVAAGVFTPRPKVFQPAIQHVLVLCTTTEIVFVGVCHAGDHFEEIQLETLAQYRVPTDNVSMISVASSADGRVFFGGADGNLYEVIYNSKDTWRQKRCVKVCHTKGIRAYLPSFIPSSLMGLPQPIVQVVVDDARHVLYTRSESSVLTVFDLGAGGSDPPSKVAEVTDFAVDASRALGGREVFGRGAGDKKGAKVVYMAVVPPSVSRRIHLLTVTADGRRVYWTTSSPRNSAVRSVTSARPDRLKAEIARRAVPNSMPGGGRSSSSHHALGRSLEVLAACSVSDTLILAESAPNEGKTSIFVIARDTTIPPVGAARGAYASMPGLRESVSQLEFPLSGEAFSIREIPTNKAGVSMLPQTSGGENKHGVAQRFAVATTAGVAEVETLSPAEILSNILLDGDKDTLEMFFESYGAIEACSMCVHLACRPSGTATKSVATLAEAALDNPRLCGRPEITKSKPAGGGGENLNGLAEEPAAHLSSGFDMGAVIPIAEPEWSAAHKGVCTVVSRLLRGLWDEPLFAFKAAAPDILSSTIDLPTLESLYESLRSLSDFLTRYINRRKSSRASGVMDLIGDAPISKRQKLEDAIRAELKRTEQVNALIRRVADGCYLLMVLHTRNISRLVARLEEGARRTIRSLRFREWMSHEEGDQAATMLIAALISEDLYEAGELSNELAVTLQRGCPSYFKNDDRKYYEARSLLRRAEGANSPVDRETITRDAVSLLLKVPLSCDLAQVIPQLAMLRAVDQIVQLTVKRASAIDPSKLAGEDDPAVAQPAKARRHEACYVHVCDLLKVLKGPTSKNAPASLEPFKKSLKDPEITTLGSTLLASVSSSNDPFLQESIYATLIELNCVQDLLTMGERGAGENLEQYLFQGSGLAQAMFGSPVGPLTPAQVMHAEVLAKFYVKEKKYASATGVYEHLAAQVADAIDPPRPSLVKRVQYLESAVLQARSCGDSQYVEITSTKAGLGHIQIKLEELMQRKGLLESENGGGHGADEDPVLSEISRSLLSLDTLFNDITVRYRLWKECLELINVSLLDDIDKVRQVWDLYMEEEWNAVWERRRGTDEGSLAALEAMCSSAAALGKNFHPNENSLPICHILLRFEQAASGDWPAEEQTPAPVNSAETVRKSLLQLCGGSHESSMDAYDALMSIKSSEPDGAAIHEPEMRFRVLCSIKYLVEDALRSNGLDNQYGNVSNVHKRRLLGRLASACEAYASESRQLPSVKGDTLGSEFDAIKAQLDQKLRSASTSMNVF
jgi:nuclear pore complex protein Nup155